MKDKRTVFVLGAGASCPCGYPSGARLRELICFDGGFRSDYSDYLRRNNIKEEKPGEVNRFRKIFKDANIKSIDVFMANNPKLAPIGKYIIAYEVFRAERNSCFGEEAKRIQEEEERAMDSDSRYRRDLIRGTPQFQGGDWYSYLYNRLIEGLVGKNALPDFSNGNLAFITFNYDRSLEHFLYESLRNSFTEVGEDNIVQSLGKLKILHVYGQIAPLKWQNPDDYVDYKPKTDESLLQNAANNIRTIYEEKQNRELTEAQDLLKQSDEIFFLGFGFAEENMEVLGLPGVIPPGNCRVYGTAYGLETKEIDDIHNRIVKGLPGGDTEHNSERTKIENVDCLKLLRNHL
jgi:hypothetical protein